MQKPFVKEQLDFLIARFGMTSSEILALWFSNAIGKGSHCGSGVPESGEGRRCKTLCVDFSTCRKIPGRNVRSMNFS